MRANKLGGQGVTKGRVALSVGAILGLAALVPIYGDPRATPVTHPFWARLLLEALGMRAAVSQSTHASQVFSALSWRDSLTYPADQFSRVEGLELAEADGAKLLVAGEGVGEAVFPLAVTSGGDYRVRLRLAGNPQSPAAASVTRIGDATALHELKVVPAGRPAWVNGGTIHLDPGAYTTSILLPAGASLQEVEVAPPCLNPIEPAAGWNARATTTAEDVAVTALRALDREGELPPAAAPIEIEARDFRVEGAAAVSVATTAAPDGFWLRAGDSGLEAVTFAEITDPGLYALSAFGTAGAGQRFVADACRKAILCPPPAGTDVAPRWWPIMTLPLKAGHHAFVVTLARRAGLQRLRLELKKNTPADYLATVRRLGLAIDSGPVSREAAAAAGRFVREQRGNSTRCGDTIRHEFVAPPPVVVTAAPPPPPQPPALPSPPRIDFVLPPDQPPASGIQPLATGTSRSGPGSD